MYLCVCFVGREIGSGVQCQCVFYSSNRSSDNAFKLVRVRVKAWAAIGNGFESRNTGVFVSRSLSLKVLKLASEVVLE